MKNIIFYIIKSPLPHGPCPANRRSQSTVIGSIWIYSLHLRGCLSIVSSCLVTQALAWEKKNFLRVFYLFLKPQNFWVYFFGFLYFFERKSLTETPIANCHISKFTLTHKIPVGKISQRSKMIFYLVRLSEIKKKSLNLDASLEVERHN